MLGRIFPKQIDNTYRGHWLALVLLILLTFLKLAMSANAIFNTREIASGADGFALDAYGAAGADAVLLLFALDEVARIVMALLTAIVLVRYRAMVPLMYFLLLAEHIGRRAILTLNPIERTTDSPLGLYVNLGLLAIMAAGFALSLMNRRPAKEAR